MSENWFSQLHSRVENPTKLKVFIVRQVTGLPATFVSCKRSHVMRLLTMHVSVTLLISIRALAQTQSLTMRNDGEATYSRGELTLVVANTCIMQQSRVHARVESRDLHIKRSFVRSWIFHRDGGTVSDWKKSSPRMNCAHGSFDMSSTGLLLPSILSPISCAPSRFSTFSSSVIVDSFCIHPPGNWSGGSARCGLSHVTTSARGLECFWFPHVTCQRQKRMKHDRSLLFSVVRLIPHF